MNYTTQCLLNNFFKGSSTFFKYLYNKLLNLDNHSSTLMLGNSYSTILAKK